MYSSRDFLIISKLALFFVKILIKECEFISAASLFKFELYLMLFASLLHNPSQVANSFDYFGKCFDE